MSRCFPYPPAGYALNRASEESLIESIKFPKERVKSTEKKEKSKDKNDSSNEQKEKRREKKEKRKEKKDKTNEKLIKSHLVQTHLCEETLPGTKSEQLERSSLTEEHGNPTCMLAPSTSSDSTDNNSKKRKTCSSPAEVTRGHGNIIRIRLPLKKPKIELQHCSTSERTNVASQNEITFCSSSRNDRDQICSTSQPVETMEILKSSMINTTPMQRAELQYTNLMESLVPPKPLNDADHLDWLLNGNSGESSSEKKRASGNNELACSINWGLWPRAQYLQEADMYALPYTVPF